MHYPRNAFARGNGDTIIPYDYAPDMGQRAGLSDCDVEKVQMHYRCKFKVSKQHSFVDVNMQFQILKDIF